MFWILDDSNNTFSTTGGYNVALSSVFAGQTITQNVPIPSVITSGDWSVNSSGTELTIIDDNGSASTTPILSLTSNELVLDFGGFSSISGGTGGVALVNLTGTVTFP